MKNAKIGSVAKVDYSRLFFRCHNFKILVRLLDISNSISPNLVIFLLETYFFDN